MSNKDYLNIRQFESNLKSNLDYDTYKNIFIRDDLTPVEIKKTLKNLSDIYVASSTNHYTELTQLAARKTYSNICNCIQLYCRPWKTYIYLFANAAYMNIKKELVYSTTSGYTVVYERLPLWSFELGYRPDDTYFVLSNNKIIGAFKEDMSERSIFENASLKNFTLPVIKDETIRNEVLSVITLLKLGDKT